MSLAPGHRDNFETLQRAFNQGDVALVECQLVKTGESVPVICAANHHDDGMIEFVPLAIMFNGNPYELLRPPKPEGGFQ